MKCFFVRKKSPSLNTEEDSIAAKLFIKIFLILLFTLALFILMYFPTLYSLYDATQHIIICIR